MLSPFYDATMKLSDEKRVSGSKAIPVLKMIDMSLQEKISTKITPMACQLGDIILQQLRQALHFAVHDHVNTAGFQVENNWIS